MVKIFISIFCICLFFISCKNELDLNGPTKEMMIVYGMLNANDSVHYIKVGKTFSIDNNSVYNVSKISDSLYLDSLKVELTEIETGKIILFHKNISVQKDSGIFSTYPNVLYSSSEKINKNYNYHLKVTNFKNKNTAEAKTNIVHEPARIFPSITTTTYRVDSSKINQVIFISAINSALYDLKLVMYWDEFDAQNHNFIRSDSISYFVLKDKEPSENGTFNVKIEGLMYFRFLAEKVPINNNIYRKAKVFKFEYWGANEEYFFYKKLYTQSTGITQKKPEYTNISSGNFGLFASRNYVSLGNIEVDQETSDQLRNNSDTRKLNFR